MLACSRTNDLVLLAGPIRPAGTHEYTRKKLRKQLGNYTFAICTTGKQHRVEKISPNVKNYDSNTLGDLLMKYGPLWCAGYWFGAGHIIVLTGVSSDRISFNDPDLGIAKTGSIIWFDNKVAKSVDGCLMYKDPLAY